MHLYRGSTDQFIGDAVRNRLASQLSDRFLEEFRYRPSTSEVTSWQNSLRAMADVLQLADLARPGHPRRAAAAPDLEAPRLPHHWVGPRAGRRGRHRRAEAVDERSSRSNVTDCVTALGGRRVDRCIPRARWSAISATCRTRTRPSRTALSVWTPAPTSTTRRTTRHRRCSTRRSRTARRRFPAFAGDQVDELATFLDGARQRA